MVDETEDMDVFAFILAVIWELLFLRPALAMRFFRDETSCHLWDTFRHQSVTVRRVTLFSAAQMLLFEDTVSFFSSRMVRRAC